MMKPLVTKLVSTVVALPLHLAVGVLVAGFIEVELGGPSGLDFPYVVPMLLASAPLLISIWSTGATFWRRVGAWAVGTILLTGSFTLLRPVVLKASAWNPLNGPYDPAMFFWPSAMLVVGSLLLGVLSTMLVLRVKRHRGRSAQPQESEATDAQG